jgi:hypothetical protein
VFGAFSGMLRGTLQGDETPVCALNLLHDGTHIWEQRVGLGDGEKLHSKLYRERAVGNAFGCSLKLILID